MNGTKAGKNVNAVLRNGYPLAVSTRGYGDIQKGKGPNGSDLVDEKTYYLETIDFVVNPGVKDARPVVVESEENPENPPKENENMALEKLVEDLQNEKADLKVELKEAASEVAKLTEEKKQIQEAATKKENRLVEGLRKWQQLEPFRSLGNQTRLFDGDSQPPADKIMEELYGVSEKYARLGTPEAISEKLSLLEKLLEYGNLEEHETSYKALKEYTDIDLKKSPADFKRLIEDANAVRRKFNEVKSKNQIAQISKKFKVSEKAVTEMLKKQSAKQVIENLQLLAEKQTTEQQRDPSTGKVIPIPTKPAANAQNESRAAKVFEDVQSVATPAQKNQSYLKELQKKRSASAQ